MSGYKDDIKYFDNKINMYMNRLKWLRKQIRIYTRKLRDYKTARHHYFIEATS